LLERLRAKTAERLWRSGHFFLANKEAFVVTLVAQAKTFYVKISKRKDHTYVGH